jgi:hypothetical protein
MRSRDLITEKKKRKRKIRRAAYGPGPYGMYGTDAGYSGDSGVAESLTPEKTDRIKEFVKFCFKKLNLKNKPKIKLTNNVDTTALGYFIPDTNTIVVVVKGRHGMDIMRTLAHELVHLKQSESRELDGSTGSPDENQANAMAGVLLRVWGKLHPEYFVEERKFTDLEIAIMEGGGSIEDDRTYYIRKQLEEKWSEKYKRSINCNNPKGFSQRAHCQGKKKNEASYPGNIGAMEVAKFYRIASDEEKKKVRELIKNDKKKLAWKIIQQVVGIKLQGDDFNENFADGKNPGRKGLAKRNGVNCKASVSSLRKTAKNSTGEKQRMAHWCANMKSGRNKK